MNNKNKGVTLVELMTVIAVLAIVLSLAVPSFVETLDRRNLSGAADSIVSLLHMARNENIIRQKNIYAAFQSSGSSQWCMGISEQPGCDCHASGDAANACKIDGALRIISSDNFKSLSLTTNFSENDTGFRHPQARAMEAGDITITSLTSGSTLKVNLNRVGRVYSCSNDIGGYTSCS